MADTRAPRVLLLSASFGGGHNVVARTLERELHERLGAETALYDFFATNSRLFADTLVDGYLGLLKLAPRIYGALYEYSDAREIELADRVLVYESTPKRAAQSLGLRLKRLSTERNPTGEVIDAFLSAAFWQVKRKVAQFEPDVVVCTYFMPLMLLDRMKHKGLLDVPVVGVVTDYTVHRSWLHPNIDHYVLAHPDLRFEVAQKRSSLKNLSFTGIPIDPRFAEKVPAEEARAELGLAEGLPTLTVMGGSLGLGRIGKVVKKLQSLLSDHNVVVICGSNDSLLEALRSYRPHPNLHVIGYTDRMPTYLAATDLLLTKPGGLTSAEAAAAGVPMGFLRPLPGQEEHNFDFLVNHGVAISLVDEDHLLGSVQAFLGDARGRERVREALADLGRPNALADLVALVEGLVPG